MIKQLEEQIERMSKDYKSLVDNAEQSLAKNMEQLEKECSVEQVSFIKQSLKDAKSGDLSMEDFMNSAKSFNYGG